MRQAKNHFNHFKALAGKGDWHHERARHTVALCSMCGSESELN